MSRHCFTALAVLGLLLGWLTPTDLPTRAASGLTIADVQASAASVGLYEKFELTFNVTNTVATYLDWPYDPAPPPGVLAGVGITVEGLFSNDDWATALVQPAFLYQDYVRSQHGGQDHLYPQGEPVWKIRFAPQRTGAWRYRIRATDASGTAVYTASGDLSFAVTSSDSHGFVRLSSTDPRYFELDDGTPFVGVGHNTGFSDRNPTYDAEAKFATFAANRANFFRTWMSGSSVAGSAWIPWTSHHLSYDGNVPPTSLSADQAYGDGDFSMKLWLDNPCMFQGFLGRIPVLPGRTYRLQVRVKTVDVTGPLQPGAPYGFVVKLGGWLGTACAKPDNLPPLTPYVAGNADWQVIEGTVVAGADQYLLDNLYLILENATAGAVYVDTVTLQEDLGNGRYGPNVIRKPRMNFHTYFDPMSAWGWDYILDRAAEQGIYLKLVVLDKDDWIYNHIAADGSFAPEKSNNNLYAAPDTQVRWLHQAWWRYLSARWGYSTAVHSWELLNEGDPFNGNHYEQANAFARYIHETDAQRHLATTSLWHSFPVAEFWGSADYPDLDYADLHAYVSTGWGRYPVWGNAPSPPLSFEDDPAYVRGGEGHSLRVPGGDRFHNAGITSSRLVIRGRGEWLIRFWMKAEGWVGACDYDVPNAMAGPRLTWTLDNGLPEQKTNVVPPTSQGQYFICSAPAGSYDWTQFRSDQTADGRAAPYSARLVIEDDLIHKLYVAVQNSFGADGAAWIDDIEIVAPDGAALAINGSVTLDPMDYDAARYTQAYSALYGGASPAGANMPLVRGEAGLDYPGGPQQEQADLARDTEGVWLHNLVWGQVNPGGMYDLYWWTDNIWDYALHRHFKPFRDFMDGIPLNNGAYRDAEAVTSRPDLRAWGQVDATHGQAHLWIQNAHHTWRNVVDGASIPALDGTIAIPALSSGAYQIEWWDTNGGGVVHTETVEAKAGQDCGELGCQGVLTLTLPWALTADVAVKVTRAQVDLSGSYLAVDRCTAEPGETLAYQLTLINDGNAGASGVVVVNPIPDHTAYVPGSLTASSGQALHDGPSLTWVGDVPPDDSVAISFVVTLDPTLADPVAIVDEATIRYDDVTTTRRATTLINALQIYMPLIRKDY
jgi:uncharacterized repeat protein (TIGR01451 family)